MQRPSGSAYKDVDSVTSGKRPLVGAYGGPLEALQDVDRMVLGNHPTIYSVAICCQALKRLLDL